jgi:putative oxidoreductase
MLERGALDGRVQEPGRLPTLDVRGWVLRLSAAGLFMSVGLTKFDQSSMWVKLFADIGAGDWFRCLTGALQAAGGLLFLTPKTVYAGAVLTGGTMLGAVGVHMFVLDTGIAGAVIPLVLLIFVIVVAGHRPE